MVKSDFIIKYLKIYFKGKKRLFKNNRNLDINFSPTFKQKKQSGFVCNNFEEWKQTPLIMNLITNVINEPKSYAISSECNSKNFAEFQEISKKVHLASLSKEFNLSMLHIETDTDLIQYPFAHKNGSKTFSFMTINCIALCKKLPYDPFIRHESVDSLLLDGTLLAVHILLYVLHNLIGFVHSDISPLNLMFFTIDGIWKLCDFDTLCSMPISESLENYRDRIL